MTVVTAMTLSSYDRLPLYGDWGPWFPITYVYDGEYDTILQNVALQMRSKEIAQKWAKIFGFDDYLSFRDKIKSETENPATRRKQNNLRYSMSFSDVQFLTDFINPNEMGTVR